MDIHQTIVLGMTTGSNSQAQIQTVLGHVMNFIASKYDLSIEEVSIEFY